MSNLNNMEHVTGQMYYGNMVKPEFIARLFVERFTLRELQLMLNVDDYNSSAVQAGLPGHNLMVIVSKLLGVAQIDRAVIEMAIEHLESELEWYENKPQENDENDNDINVKLNVNTECIDETIDLVDTFIKNFQRMSEGMVQGWSNVEND